MWHMVKTRRIDRYFMRGLRARPAAAMRAHLEDCGDCRERYRRQLAAEAALPDGEARAAGRLWTEIAVVSGAVPSRRVTWPLLTLAAAAMAVFFIGRDRDIPWRAARGPIIVRPPSLHLFRTAEGRAQPVTGPIRSDDGLLLAYSNPGGRYSHLMVLAVDERRRVYWFYPAYQQIGTDPSAVPITNGHGVELGEEIRHHFPPGRLRLVGLFLDRATRVQTVEAAVASALAARGIDEDVDLAVTGAWQWSTLLKVMP